MAAATPATAESGCPRPGSRFGSGAGVGWLFALADRQVGAAIGAMHDDPKHRWTLRQLAEGVGMSRSVFAEKFKATVGTSPMEYLTCWAHRRGGTAAVRVRTKD